MEVLKVRLTRGDATTIPGGVILYVKDHGDIKEYIAHDFTRDYGSRRPKEFFWGSYCSTLEHGEESFKEKLAKRMNYTTGGSLIPIEDEEAELEMEKSRVK
jgi:hypothetical protein